MPSMALTGVGFFMLALAETSRVPVDDPATHLELTMIHEVIVLDHSGPELAMVLYGNAVKIALFSALVVSVLVPRGLPCPLPPRRRRSCSSGWCWSLSSEWSRRAWHACA